MPGGRALANLSTAYMKDRPTYMKTKWWLYANNNLP